MHCPGATAVMVMAAIALVSFVGCGNDSPSPSSSDEGNPNINTPPNVIETVEDLILSESYAGHLVVHFDENLVVRQDASKSLYSLAGQDDALSLAKAAIASVSHAQLIRSMQVSEKKLDEQREKLERLSGQRMPDWNSIYHLKTETPEDAIDLLHQLQGQPGITKIYPALIPYPAGLLATPNLTGWQTYLLPENTHGGLNAQAAWALGVDGGGVYVVDNERGTNFDHEDLGLIATDIDVGGNFFYTPVCAPGFPYLAGDCPSSIAHGVAVAGILVAQDNGHGVTGFAPQAHYVQASMLGGTFSDLAAATDGIDAGWTDGDDDMEPGSIWLIEVQLPGKFSAGSCGETIPAQVGCVPTEMWPEDFAAIQQATAYGVTVVNGAGNGSWDLNDPNLYTGDWDFAHNLGVEDAGSIMVGASQGSNEQKATFSNCGNRVNAFAWGQNVVSTGYPYGAYAWNGAVPPVPANDPLDPNNFYINNFGGTSSATAMVGGAVALVQSYARGLLGEDRYLMPAQMRQIVVNSGVNQVGGGCNIGKQPRIDQALTAALALVNNAKAAYPQLNTGVRLTSPQMIALRAMGVGIICKEFDPSGSDPICPESEIYPPGSGIAKPLDFDGDGRSDLVRWTNGTWKLDLSGQGPNADHFGAWDIEIAHPALPGQWVWPYVADMNSDGRTDFVVYDKEQGKFYIALTDLPLIMSGTWHGWDKIVDYSATWHDDLNLNPNLSHYSRPAIADYNADGWNDIGIACSDGFWRIDFGNGNLNSFAAFDVSAQYLSPAQLAAAPGWAYPTTLYGTTNLLLAFKVPDGLPQAGRLFLVSYLDPGFDQLSAAGGNPDVGGNDDILLTGYLDGYGSGPAVTIKGMDGGWRVSSFDVIDVYLTPTSLSPTGIYGGNECHPIIGDFDGDEYEDRAVMCPDGWKIAYHDPASIAPLLHPDGSRHIPLGYSTSTFTLPGQPYSGGIGYSYVQQLIQFFQQTHPGIPPPIPVDMVVFH